MIDIGDEAVCGTSTRPESNTVKSLIKVIIARIVRLCTYGLQIWIHVVYLDACVLV